MKIKYLVPAILLVAIAVTSCRKSVILEPENCLERIEKVSDALNAYVQDPTTGNCKAYLDALKSYINSNACFGNIFFEEYQRALNEAEEEECQ
jgi:hypothetical protein